MTMVSVLLLCPRAMGVFGYIVQHSPWPGVMRVEEVQTTWDAKSSVSLNKGIPASLPSVPESILDSAFDFWPQVKKQVRELTDIVKLHGINFTLRRQSFCMSPSHNSLNRQVMC